MDKNKNSDIVLKINKHMNGNYSAEVILKSLSKESFKKQIPIYAPVKFDTPDGYMIGILRNQQLDIIVTNIEIEGMNVSASVTKITLLPLKDLPLYVEDKTYPLFNILIKGNHYLKDC